MQVDVYWDESSPGGRVQRFALNGPAQSQNRLYSKKKKLENKNVVLVKG
jgi:hypothetical protein